MYALLQANNIAKVLQDRLACPARFLMNIMGQAGSFLARQLEPKARLACARKFLIEVWLGSLELENF